jgi:hypothetical protein
MKLIDFKNNVNKINKKNEIVSIDNLIDKIKLIHYENFIVSQFQFVCLPICIFLRPIVKNFKLSAIFSLVF